MATISSGIFSLREFKNREVLKLAPDAFITVGGGLFDSRVVIPLGSETNTVTSQVAKSLEMRGGITSINVSSAVSPPGSGRATIDITAPQYKGLHEDYYVTLPSGVRACYFVPTMEIKIYMKGRYLDDRDFYKPKYYPVFWGIITEISESYNGGNFSISLTCGDMLTWWKYQKVIIVPSVFTNDMGGPKMTSFPTIFKNLNPWQLMLCLFNDSYFMNADGEGNIANFVYQRYSQSMAQSLLRDQKRDSIKAMANDVTKYWANRFGYTEDPKDTLPKIPLEMYGFRGILGENKQKQLFNEAKRKLTPDGDGKAFEPGVSADLDLDYNLLARVMPYGAFSNWGSGTEPMEATKLEIAQNVCEQASMEFFVDTNGFFVFKPPFYNLEVLKGGVNTYILESKDIINFSSSIVSDNICNYLECVSPQYYSMPELELIGYHIDFELLRRFGMKFQTMAMRFGNTATELNMIAAAEMSKINAKAFTASASIPLRPEMRLGYPVYVDYIDAYYYVTGIQHSFTFGSSSSTTLNLESRRDRVYDTDKNFEVLKSRVYRFNPNSYQDNIENRSTKVINDPSDNDRKRVELTDSIKRNSNIISGVKTTGFYSIDEARYSPNATVTNSDSKQAIMSNELVMITDETVPYTDVRGYRHIGAFPYGANLQLQYSGELIDGTDPKAVSEAPARANAGIGPDEGAKEVTTSDNNVPNTLAPESGSSPVTDMGSPPPPIEKRSNINPIPIRELTEEDLSYNGFGAEPDTTDVVLQAIEIRAETTNKTFIGPPTQ